MRPSSNPYLIRTTSLSLGVSVFSTFSRSSLISDFSVDSSGDSPCHMMKLPKVVLLSSLPFPFVIGVSVESVVLLDLAKNLIFCDGLSDPPGSVGGELESFIGVEFFRATNKSD